jgi:hypothetical protein
MGFWDKLFGENKNEAPKGKVKNKKQYPLRWIEEKDNPWKIRLLDLRPISKTMLSSSHDPLMASNAISYSQEDGLSFLNHSSKSNKSFDADFSFSIDNKLEPGVLFTPSTMENKWAIYFHESKIIFIRSWLRKVLVIAETVQEKNQLIVKKVFGEFTENESTDFTTSVLRFLIHSHVLNEVVPAPIPKEFEDNTDDAGMWAFSTYGNMAHLGYFGTNLIYNSESKLRSHSLLHIAIAKGQINKIEEELNKGVNINILAGDGLSTLQWAMAAELNIMEFLLKKGANPNVESIEGATPIMNAVQSNKMQHLKLLIQFKGDVNAKDKRGFTALHRAAEMGYVEMVKELLSHGANKDVEVEGYTALSLAKARNNGEIIRLLE